MVPFRVLYSFYYAKAIVSKTKDCKLKYVNMCLCKKTIKITRGSEHCFWCQIDRTEFEQKTEHWSSLKQRSTHNRFCAKFGKKSFFVYQILVLFRQFARSLTVHLLKNKPHVVTKHHLSVADIFSVRSLPTLYSTFSTFIHIFMIMAKTFWESTNIR